MYKYNKKHRNWFERLVERFGGDREAIQEARTHSKHARAKTKPHGWHRSLRRSRKTKRQARKAQRGK